MLVNTIAARSFGESDVRADSISCFNSYCSTAWSDTHHVWLVDNAGAEGIVLRSESAGSFKIKPRHSIDAAVIGFTESIVERAGLLHDLLLAVMRQDGTLHVLRRVGGGFTDNMRREMLADLKDHVVAYEYAEVNSDHIVYQMVEPRWVAEISCLDLVSQSSRGTPIQRMTLDWDIAAATYRVVRRLPLVSVISPQFERLRDDKTASMLDIRVAQVADVVEVPFVDRDARQMTLPKSELLRREVYTKQLKGETMVRKFVLWRTHKEQVSNEFPAYVIHFTDFSPNRATPLARDVRVSNSQGQIEQLWRELVDENVKKGWEPVPVPVTQDSTSPANGQSVTEPDKATSKSATKKSVTGKSAPKKKAASVKEPRTTG